MNAKIYNGNVQPNPKEFKIWVNDEGVIKTWNGTKWIELSGGSGESGGSGSGSEGSKYEFVDLGLPSGTKWATTNVGATKPEEFGLYFAWGETEGYEGITDDKKFEWNDYKLCGGSDKTLTKYNSDSSCGVVDNLSSLEQVDDAAYTSNNICRIPTKAELKELAANTTSTWETLNGVDGRRFTSKTNGNSIFIPAAGHCLDGSVYDVGSSGWLLSSSLKMDSRNAWGLPFKSDIVEDMDYFQFPRCHGWSVRAVKE